MNLKSGALSPLWLALLLTSTATGAVAAPRHRQQPPVAAVSQAEVEALKAQIAALSARLDAAEASLRTARDAADQSRAGLKTIASAVTAQQQAVQATIDTLPKQIAASVTAANAPLAWAARTQIGSIVFADVSAIDQTANGARVAPSGVGLDVKRFYVSVDHRFNDVFSADVTTDASYASSVNDVQVWIKKAYLQARLSDALVLSAGSNSLPWAPYSESLYGLRFVEKTLIDRAGVGFTTDWGVHVAGRLADGLIGYQVSVINGGTFKNPSRSRSVDVEGRVSLAWQGVNLGIGGYSGDLGKDQAGAGALHTATRFNAVAAYVQPAFRLGLEYFRTSDWTAVTTVAGDRSEGFAAFGAWRLQPKLTVFARYDAVRPNQITAPGKKDIYVNFGLDWAVDKQIDLALVYKHEKVEGGVFTGASGAIGAATGLKVGAYDELGVWTQYKY